VLPPVETAAAVAVFLRGLLDRVREAGSAHRWRVALWTVLALTTVAAPRAD
jgi:hypothetical protein